MKMKLFGVAVALLLTCSQLCWSSAPDDSEVSAQHPRLIIHLPRETTVEGERLTLGQVAVVTGREPFASKAREIGLGRISIPGQKVTIDRSLILSRLACSEIADCVPVLSGADSVTVRHNTTVITGQSFIESASLFLSDNIRDKAITGWQAAREPAKLALPEKALQIDMVPRLVSRGANGQAVTEVSVVADGKLIGTRQVVFRPRYNISRAVTVAEVSAGETITPDNTRVEKVISNEPPVPDWTVPYGLVAVRRLPAGTVISPEMAVTPRPEVVVERNQTVVVRVERPGLVVTAMGKAMEKGRLGECIKVRNLDSQRVILAKVNEDGTVEPVF